MSTPGYYDTSYPPSIFTPQVPDPAITTLVPNTGSAAAGPVTVQVNGSNFLPGSVIEINQAAAPTTYVSATRLTTSYDPATTGTVQFTVRNGGAGGQESNSVPFTVTALAASTTRTAKTTATEVTE
jgi:IPT/TIG domain